MTTTLTINNVSFDYPETGDENWGADATGWAEAVSADMLQKSGGLFILGADVDFGPNFGLESLYYLSRTANAATTGVVRLANGDSIAIRDSGNTANQLLKAGSADGFISFDGVDLADITGTQTLSNKTLSSPLILGGSIDVTAAGSLAIGASVGGNNLTLGGIASTVVVAGNLDVQGSTTTVNTATLDVEDTNVTVNKGGNDASGEGAGLTVERTGTDGSIIYEDALASKWKAGALGSEVELADISTAQTLTNKTLGAGTVVSDSSVVDHDATTNFAADEHVAHSGVTLTAGVGLTGGGDISANRTFDADIPGLTPDAAPDGSLDYVMTYDDSASTHKKVLLNNLPSGGVSTIGTIDSETKAANAAVIAGSTLVMQSADASNPGVVTTAAQTFAGAKTFTSPPTIQGTIPSLRLDDTNDSQIWRLGIAAGNLSFVDQTNSDAQPLTVEPGAPTGSLSVDSSGDTTFGGSTIVDGFIQHTVSTVTATATSSGAITPTSSFTSVNGFGGATSTITTINALSNGRMLYLKKGNATINVAEGGNLFLETAGTFALASVHDRMVLICDGTNWQELSRSDNN